MSVRHSRIALKGDRMKLFVEFLGWAFSKKWGRCWNDQLPCGEEENSDVCDHCPRGNRHCFK
jgi:hypothetical protein